MVVARMMPAQSDRGWRNVVQDIAMMSKALGSSNHTKCICAHMVVQKRLSDGIMRQELHALYYPASRRALQARTTLLFGSVRFATFVSMMFGRYRIRTYQQVPQQDDDCDLANGRYVYRGLFLDLRTEILGTHDTLAGPTHANQGCLSRNPTFSLEKLMQTAPSRSR